MRQGNVEYPAQLLHSERGDSARDALAPLVSRIPRNVYNNKLLGRLFEDSYNERRYFTDQNIRDIFELSNASPEEREKVWTEILRSIDSIFERIRQFILKAGCGIQAAAERLSISDASLANILKHGQPMRYAVWKLMVESFGMDPERAHYEWQRDTVAFLQSKGFNALGAEIQTLFFLNPSAKVETWIRNKDRPAALPSASLLSGNELKGMLQRVRHGVPVSFEFLHRTLFALGAMAYDRIRAARAWAYVSSHKIQIPNKSEFSSFYQAGELHHARGGDPHRQSMPYPEEYAEKQISELILRDATILAADHQIVLTMQFRDDIHTGDEQKICCRLRELLNACHQSMGITPLCPHYDFSSVKFFARVPTDVRLDLLKHDPQALGALYDMVERILKDPLLTCIRSNEQRLFKILGKMGINLVLYNEIPEMIAKLGVKNASRSEP